MSIRKTFASSVAMTMFGLAAGETLIVNGDFKADGMRFPPYWMFVNYFGGRVDYFRSGGPDDRAFVRLSSSGGTTRLQQNNLRLVQGEKYRVGAWFRTQNVLNKTSGIRVGPGSFAQPGENSLTGLPANTGEWKYYEREITLNEEEKPHYRYYTVDIVLDSGGGVLDVAGVRLDPVTEKARKESLSQMDAMEPHLVPVSPLWHIPKDKPALDFFWVGRFPGDPDSADCEFIFSRDGRSGKIPFRLSRFTADFSGILKPGEQTMTVRILSRAGQRVWHEETFPVRCTTVPEVKNAKVLNNFVTELYNGALAAGEKITLPNPRYGFLLFRFLPENKEKFTILLDGKPLFTEKAPRSETIRALEPGEYSLEVKGARGTFIARLIPDVMTFALMTPRAPGNGVYNWEFARKYIVPGMTTLTVAGLSKAEYAELKELGRQYLDNYGIQNWNHPNIAEDNLARMEKDKVFSSPQNDGTTIDESECWYPLMLDPYAWALKKFKNPHDKLIVTYQTGPVTPSYLNVISAAANVSKGRGWLAFEVYPREPDNEKDAEKQLFQLGQHWDIFRDAAPGLFGKAGLLLGNFSMHPQISLAHHPGVDYKYYLDMQLCAAANQPSFQGLGKLGFWGTYAADEEIVRWSFRLMRHYAFEGNRNMLSEKYGFQFLPGHLRNGDFTEGLKFWQGAGGVHVDRFPGYGKNSLRFHGSAGTGDVFAVFPRTKESHAELTQAARGLVKGKKYLLYFYAGDLDDIINNRQIARRIGIELELTGAEILQSTRYTGNNTKSKHAWVNTHKIIFRALRDSAELRFSNRKSEPGSSSVLNYICLRPYYDVEPVE